MALPSTQSPGLKSRVFSNSSLLSLSYHEPSVAKTGQSDVHLSLRPDLTFISPRLQCGIRLLAGAPFSPPTIQPPATCPVHLPRAGCQHSLPSPLRKQQRLPVACRTEPSLCADLQGPSRPTFPAPPPAAPLHTRPPGQPASPTERLWACTASWPWPVVSSLGCPFPFLILRSPVQIYPLGSSPGLCEQKAPLLPLLPVSTVLILRDPSSQGH